MGAFGIEIIGDDTVADIVGFLVDRLKAGVSLEQASAEAPQRFHELEMDADEAPLLYLAIAHTQWRYGRVSPAILQRVRDDVRHGSGLDRWKDDPTGLRRRLRALEAFLAKIERPNPKPSAFPTQVVRPAPFAAGDCLAISTSDGRHTAALVLAADNSNAEHGRNLVAGLDYLSDRPPPLEVFEHRKWLQKRHGNWNGEPDLAWYLPARFTAEKGRIHVVGRVELRESDPKESSLHSSWASLGTQILLCRPGIRDVDI